MAKGRWDRTKRLERAAHEVLEAEQPMTVRQLFYRLVSIGAIENSRRDYQRLSRLMTVAREQRRIPFKWIVDRSRPTYAPSVFDNLTDGLRALRDCYHRDRWMDQPVHVEVWVEKDAIIGSIEDVAVQELGVPIRVGRGFNSATMVNSIAELFTDIQKPIVVSYLGDHDPSGRCIEREVYERVQRYGSGPFEMRRLAIHAADIKKFNLPPLRAKETDSRSAGFRKQYGDDCVELDALPPAELRRRVRKAIERVIESKSWQRADSVEKTEIASIRHIVAIWPTLANKMRGQNE